MYVKVRLVELGIIGEFYRTSAALMAAALKTECMAAIDYFMELFENGTCKWEASMYVCRGLEVS
jgi:hypothetical protein